MFSGQQAVEVSSSDRRSVTLGEHVRAVCRALPGKSETCSRTAPIDLLTRGVDKLTGTDWRRGSWMTMSRASPTTRRTFVQASEYNDGVPTTHMGLKEQGRWTPGSVLGVHRVGRPSTPP